jgi:ATP-dependent DNA helicase RecG
MENETIEYKKSLTQLKEGLISIVAILNKHGKGKLFFGVDSSRKVHKQVLNEKTLRDISQTISNHIEPKIYPEIKLEKNYILINFSGNEIPYFAYGRCYIRVSDEDKKLSQKELKKLFNLTSNWDLEKTNLSLNEINEITLKQFIKKSNGVGRLNFSYTNKEDILIKLKLLNNNACKMLFSKNPLSLQCAIFAGKTKNTFLDIKRFEGNIYELLDYAKNYIIQNIKWRAELELNRKEIPEIPKRAFVEAIVNSFAHRTYQNLENNKIAIYSDRIEIWNPGSFPESFSPQDYIDKELPSILRNSLISNILYLSNDIESWGSGIKRLYNDCKKENINVDFKNDGYGFSVIFYRNVDKNVDKYVDKKSRQKSILDSIKNGDFNIRDFAFQKMINKKTIERDLLQLKKQGYIKRIGPAKGGYWKILK